MAITSADLLVEVSTYSYSENYNHTIGMPDMSLAELKGYSRAILHSIVYGNHKSREIRFLRGLYWYTMEILVRLESNE